MKTRRILTIGTAENSGVVANAISHWAAVEAVCCSTLEEARRPLLDASLSLIFCEDEFDDGTYRDVLYMLDKPSKNRVVVISSAPDLDEKYDEARELGAFDVISSPCRRNDVQWAIVRTIHEKTTGRGQKSTHRSDPEGRNHGAASTSERALM